MTGVVRGNETIVVDCRWLSYTGIGRVTQYFLEGLAEVRPSDQWVLWGPSDIGRYLWPGARPVYQERPPLALAAQRDLLAVPSGGATIFLHAVRPLVRRPRMAVLLHDVIPVRHAHGRVRRAGWRAFFKRSTADAAVVLVYSEATAKGAVEVLGLPPTKLCRVRLPVDLAMAGRIRQRRRESKDRWAGMLYVGQVKSHKNLDRALLAYARSRYAAEGGRFTLVASGGPGAECLRALAESRGIPGFLVLPRLTEDELEEAYAGAAFVIQPSLEEGFGLPVVEALAAGIPVCCSSGGAVEEAAAGAAELFEPTSVSSIAAAIDRTAELARAEESSPHPTRFKLPEMATPADFANEIVAAVASR